MQCPVRLSLEKVQQLLQHHGANLLNRFNRFALSDFVQSHELLRWCPGADCSIVFQVKVAQAKKVTCSKCHSSCWYVGCCHHWTKLWFSSYLPSPSSPPPPFSPSSFKCGEDYHCPTSELWFLIWPSVLEHVCVHSVELQALVHVCVQCPTLVLGVVLYSSR